MIVCICRNLNEEKVREILALCPSTNEEQKMEEFKYFVGQGCGNCYTHILAILREKK
jgi:bacterioferritin-associated ferredoxin